LVGLDDAPQPGGPVRRLADWLARHRGIRVSHDLIAPTRIESVVMWVVIIGPILFFCIFKH
jgi:hypothetical protein